jgi:hypothetical protein
MAEFCDRCSAIVPMLHLRATSFAPVTKKQSNQLMLWENIELYWCHFSRKK